MSETKWTPGPWTNDNDAHIYDGRDELVAIVAALNDDDAEAGIANLIAAAPDLYAALVETRSRLASEGMTTVAIDAALAKARGEQA